MKKAIATAEFSTVSAGIRAADTMAKTAEVELIEAGPVCPGKYLIVVAGDLASVNAAMDAARAAESEKYISGFVLGNPHEGLLPAFYGTAAVPRMGALGVFETFDAATLVAAADAAAKTAHVDLLEVRLAKGMCGKSFATLTGEVAAVEAAVARAKTLMAETGMFLDACVIARPHEGLTRFLM